MGAFGGSYLNHHWLVCACTPMDADAPRARARSSTRAASSRSAPTRRPRRCRAGRTSSTAASRPTASPSTPTQPPYQPSGIPPAPGGDRDLADPAQPSAAAAARRRPSATRSRRRASPGPGTPAAGTRRSPTDGRTRREAQRDLRPRRRQPDLPAAPPAVQLLRALRAGQRGSRTAPQGLRRPRRRHRQGHAAAGRRSTSPPGRSTSIRATPTDPSGDEHIAELLARLQKSPQWTHMAVIVTYDENGGFWDHVPPPRAGLERPLGAGHAHPDDHRLAICASAATSTRRSTTRPRS